MDLIQPIFVNENQTEESPLGENNKLYNISDIHDRIKKDIDLGINKFLLFCVPLEKDTDPKWQWQGEVVHEIKNKHDINLHVDICLCSTMPDGHCNVTDDPKKTEQLLQEQASVVSVAGADVLAPSDCQPNTVVNMKQYIDKPVMSYSAKFRSVFYHGWRDAVNIDAGIVRDYQLNPRESNEAIERCIKYANDGADYMMVKPGMPSLDLIYPIQRATGLPTGVYQTSGEYMGLPRAPGSLLETYYIFKRAGADYMITYGARDLTGEINE